MITTRGKNRVTSHQLRRWGQAAGLLVVVAGARAMLYRPPPVSDAYFQRVVAVAAETPTRFDSWVSMDAPVPQAAVTMLRPNLTISKKYTNLKNGQQASFLLVQCSDAHSLLGHFPPNCYVSSGFKQTAASSRDWELNGLTIQGMVYAFVSASVSDPSSMLVYDFMILPDGRTCRDMDGVNAIAKDPHTSQLGAAQLQILVDSAMPEEQRDALFLTLVQLHRKTIDTILAGVP